MKKRLQVILNEDAWASVESLMKEATKDFDVGEITYSDAISEMVISSRVDIKALQVKHTDLKRSLRVLASKQDVDPDLVIKSMMELKAKSSRKKIQNHEEVMS